MSSNVTDMGGSSADVSDNKWAKPPATAWSGVKESPKGSHQAQAIRDLVMSKQVPAIRVLIIEDCDTDFVVVCKVLELVDKQCYQISRATGVNDALAELKTRSFDVCLVDYMLRDGTGVELIAAARAMESAPPAILITGNNDREVDVQAMQAGAVNYLYKESINPSVIECCIRYTIERHRTMQSLVDVNCRLAAEITERCASEAREAQLGRIIEDSLNEIYIFDASTLRFCDVNRGARENLGYSLDELKAMTLLDLKPDNDKESFWKEVQPLIDEVVNVVRFETTHQRKDGSCYPVDVHLQLSRRGENARFVAMVLNISDRKLAEAELASLQRAHLETARFAGMAEIATDVLHSAGNVLNSVNVSASLLADRLITGRVDNLQKAVAMLEEHSGNPGPFLTTDEKGRRLPGYLKRLADSLSADRDFMQSEVKGLSEKIDHIKEVIQVQQAYARRGEHIEDIELSQLVESAIKVNDSSLIKNDITVIRKFDDVPTLKTVKHQVLRILVNLISNARNAMSEHDGPERCLTVRISHADDVVNVEVQDTGSGIEPENLDRIFFHGFTTRREGRGFGLHNSANTAAELGGSLTAESEGIDHGAVFTLALPLKRNESWPAV